MTMMEPNARASDHVAKGGKPTHTGDGFEEVDADALIPPPLPPSFRLCDDDRIRNLQGGPIAELGTCFYPVRSSRMPRLATGHAPPQRRSGRRGRAAVALAVFGVLAVPFALGLSRGDSSAVGTAPPMGSEPVVRIGAPAPTDLDARPIAGASGSFEPETPLDDATDRSPGEHVLSIAPVLVKAQSAAGVEKPRAPRPAENADVNSAFDYGAALQALGEAPPASAICGAAVVGSARVSATFAPSGKATRVLVLSDPLKGTEAGGCVARMLREVTVPPYAFGFVTVTETIALR